MINRELTNMEYNYNKKILCDYIDKHNISIEEIMKVARRSEIFIKRILNGKSVGSISMWNRIGNHFGLEFKPCSMRSEEIIVQRKDINGIPLYVFDCLHKYGNTTVTKKLMKKIGIQNFFITLKDGGFEVKIHEDDYDGYIIELA